MNGNSQHIGLGSGAPEILADALRNTVRGDVRFDALSRTIYATDAGIHEIVPLGVVLPRDVDDVVAVVRACRDYGTSIVPRGGGTGLTGGAVGPGVQLDLSRHMNRIGLVDRNARTVEVQPGVVLDELNAHLAPTGLMFAPDVATSSRATIGGMIANNSCGARSIVYGRTVDHIAALTVVLSSGEVARFDVPPAPTTAEDGTGTALVRSIEDELARIRDANHDEIERRFPKIMRSNGGYGLDRLGLPGSPAPAVNILCGSEGTLGVGVGATLRLVEPPEHRALVVFHFDHLLDALETTPAMLRHDPSAVELIDRLILEAGRANPILGKRCDFLKGDPAALMLVELQDDELERLRSRVDALTEDPGARTKSIASVKILETDRQADVWNLRKAGLGLLMSKAGDAQPHAFVEDSAVEPDRLREYIERFTAILDAEGVDAGSYAHAGAGCIHVRPVINLKSAPDISKMRRIADAVSSLALEFGGTMTGEHGDGIVRSCWLEKMYGPKIISAFGEIKRLFDPHNLFNPNKIVDPLDMTEHLRYGPSFASQSPRTYLDFTTHGGMAGLAGMCSGLGQCRQRLVGTMCPSYMATGDEKHTTRARANALRVALSNRGLLEGLDEPQLADVMDLCLSCKACKTECPTGVDMARLKSEYLSHRNLTRGVSARARLVADMPRRLALASRFPRMSNALTQSKPLRWLLERRYGLDRRIAPPRLAHQTFRAWFDRHRKAKRDRPTPRGRVVYFLDTWTNYYTPQVGIAAVELLERAGFDVLCPRTQCCGRPAISQGLLTEAKHLAELNIQRLAPLARAGVPIVGTEPSCILTLVDEYPQLVRTHTARRVAQQSVMMETFLRDLLDREPAALTFRDPQSPLLYHAHCHQKAIVGTGDAVELLNHVWRGQASEIDCGCCGMAGVFGHEKEHYDVARAIGEQRLFPAVRERGNAVIALSGFSCRQQIEHHTSASPRHLVEYLAEMLR